MVEYDIRTLNITEYKQWDDLIKTAPGGSVFNSSAWLEAIAYLFNRELKIWGVYRQDELVAGTGLVRFRPSPFMEIAGYLPLTPYTSIVIRPRNSDKETKNASYRLKILDLLAETLTKEADVISIVNSPALIDLRSFSWKGWGCRPYYTYMIDVSDPKSLWSQVYHDVRKQVRKCRREGIEVECGTNSKALYQLYHQTYEKQGRGVYINEATFCSLCDVLEADKRLVVYIARLNNQPISGLGIVKDYRGVIHEWIAGTDPDYLQQGVASFMLWTAIEELSAAGFRCFDLNGANVRSIARHKSQLNGVLTPYYEINNHTFKAIMFKRSWEWVQTWGIADWLKQKILRSTSP